MSEAPAAPRPAAPAARGLAAMLGIAPAELPAFAAGFAMFLLAAAGYFMLRPVREAMGIAGGVENLQWLFTATFVATLAFVPGGVRAFGHHWEAVHPGAPKGTVQ